MYPVGKYWDQFYAAATFLTRIALPRPRDLENRKSNVSQGDSVWAYPVVGLLVGLIAGIPLAICAAFGLPSLVGALLAVVTGVLVTAGLHEDGLADSADGLGGGWSREDKLRIMRDSAVGVYGALALGFSVGMRTYLLADFPPAQAVAALLVSHAVARGAVVLPMHGFSPAQPKGLGASAGKPFPGVVAITLILVLVIPFFLVPPVSALFAGVGGISAVFLFVFAARRLIGGYTGDVLGAAEQLAEIAVLAILLTAHVLQTG